MHVAIMAFSRHHMRLTVLLVAAPRLTAVVLSETVNWLARRFEPGLAGIGTLQSIWLAVLSFAGIKLINSHNCGGFLDESLELPC